MEELNKIPKFMIEDSYTQEIDNQFTDVTTQLAQTTSEVSTLKINKADKTYVDTNISTLDTKINSQASGSPKGTYATLTELQTAFPTGNTNIYLVTVDGNWYYWNGSAWTSGGVYQSTGIAEGVISPKNTNFIKVSSNLMDVRESALGYTISLSTGELISDSNYTTTKFLDVEEGITHTFIGGNRIAFYDINKQFKSNQQYQYYSTANQFTVPTGAKFVRIVLHNSRVSTAQLNLGAELLPYEEFHLPKLSTEIKVEGTVDADIKYTYNLYENQYIKGMLISATTNSLYPSTNGRVAYITVESGRKYTIQVEGVHDRFSIGFSNSITGQAPVKIVQVSNNADEYSIITTSNDENHQYLLVGVSVSSQEPTITICEGEKIAPSVKINEKKVMLEGDILPFDYSTLKRYASYYEKDFIYPNNPSTHTALYALFDELVTLGNGYVTKTVKGTNAQGLEIIEYKFSKPNILNQSNLVRPKIGLLGGLHGEEKNPPMGMYFFFKDLITNPNKNEILDKIKANVDFYVLPCSNPTGWNNHTRTNGQDVDLNRNFTTNWETTVSDKKGSSPASELETQIIEEWMANNLFDLFIDFHTSNQGSTDHRLSWFVADSNSHRISLEKQFSKTLYTLSTLWSDRHPEMPKNTVFGDIPPYSVLSQSFRHAGSFGKKACLLEISEQLRYFADVFRYGHVWTSEIFGNFMYEVCKEYI